MCSSYTLTMLIGIMKALVAVVVGVFVAPIVGLLSAIAVFCTTTAGFWIGVAKSVVDFLEPPVEKDEETSVWEKHARRLQAQKALNKSSAKNESN
jgi:hypothetical protein